MTISLRYIKKYIFLGEKIYVQLMPMLLIFFCEIETRANFHTNSFKESRIYVVKFFAKL